MSSTTDPPTRRERLRAEALGEIRTHGYRQIAAGGPTALSLNGIAKAMGMSGPAMYRYFSSRDELLSTLVTESYDDLADALEQAADRARRRAPAGRLQAILDANRDWALRQPHRYRLIFGSVYGTGDIDPERIIPAAHRGMALLLRALHDLRAPGARLAGVDAVLRRELCAWDSSRSGGSGYEPELLALAVTTWTHLHGLISLEIEGTLSQMGLDAARLYRREIDDVVRQLSEPGQAP